MKNRLVANFERKVFLLFSALAVLSLSPRIGSSDYIAESLWCEDGSLLINQAFQLGIESLWTPAAGYLHLYHRIVALLATLVPLAITPVIYFVGWIAAFLLIVWVIASRGHQAGIDRASAAFLILVISLQPNDGETFLNLGQSFYFLNIALALYACLPTLRPITLPYLFLLALLSLSGPGSEIISVILLIRLIILRDFALRKWEYLTIWFFAGVQAILTALSYHDGLAREFDRNALHWGHAVFVFFSFGSRSELVRVAALVFWLTTLACLVKRLWVLKENIRDTLWLSPFLAMLTAGAFFLAGLIRESDDLVNMNPLDHEARYYVLPYALSFLVAFSVTQNKMNARMTVLFSLALICGGTFLTLDRPGRMGTTGLYGHENLQWVAFTKFKKVIPTLEIPINPPWAMAPPYGWFVQVRSSKDGPKPNVDPINLDVAGLTSENSELILVNDELTISSANESPKLEFSLQNSCSGKQYLALEVGVWRSKPGWARLYWGRTGFSEKKSLVRFYSSGNVTMQFAFRRDMDDSALRLDLMEGVGHWLLQDWRRKRVELNPDLLKQYPEFLTVVPPPTDPGGDARVKRLSLFCLE